jgi:hypothetical protein
LTAIGNPTEAASVQFRMEIDSRYKAVRTLSASGSFSRPLAFVTGGWSKRLRIPGLVGFDAIGTSSSTPRRPSGRDRTDLAALTR